MPELRWILTIFGAALLIGIYLWGRRNTAKSQAAGDLVFKPRPEPAFEVPDAYEPPIVDVADDAYFDEANTPLEVAERLESRKPVPAHAESDESTIEVHAARADREGRTRIEPTFTDESITAELPARDPEPMVPPKSVAPTASDAPTLSMSSTPAPRRIERRKIIALRLAMPQRVSGVQLREALETESLHHGKYDVFHRLDDEGVAIFSVASMVEPGTFDIEKMPQEFFPGITLFAQLPGPVPGMLAFNELIACSKRLHAALGGTLQDERGVPLTVHRIERIRQEIREFEQRPAYDPSQRSNHPVSPSP